MLLVSGSRGVLLLILVVRLILISSCIIFLFRVGLLLLMLVVMALLLDIRTILIKLNIWAIFWRSFCVGLPRLQVIQLVGNVVESGKLVAEALHISYLNIFEEFYAEVDAYLFHHLPHVCAHLIDLLFLKVQMQLALFKLSLIALELFIFFFLVFEGRGIRCDTPLRDISLLFIQLFDLNPIVVVVDALLFAALAKLLVP